MIIAMLLTPFGKNKVIPTTNKSQDLTEILVIISVKLESFVITIKNSVNG